MVKELDTTARHVLDFAAYAGVIGTVLGWLPVFAALLSCVWLSFQVYDRVKYGPMHKRGEDNG